MGNALQSTGVESEGKFEYTFRMHGRKQLLMREETKKQQAVVVIMFLYWKKNYHNFILAHRKVKSELQLPYCKSRNRYQS